mgnify:CR=1 FL=1
MPVNQTLNVPQPSGTVTALTGVKIGRNVVVPFVASNLGVLAGDRSARA